MTTPKQERFYVDARMAISVGVEISARTLEEAVEKAKTMKMDSFVEVLGDQNDSNFRIAGVYLASCLPDA